MSRYECFVLRIFLFTGPKLVSAVGSVPSNNAVVRPRTVETTTAGFDQGVYVVVNVRVFVLLKRYVSSRGLHVALSLDVSTKTVKMTYFDD